MRAASGGLVALLVACGGPPQQPPALRNLIPDAGDDAGSDACASSGLVGLNIPPNDDPTTCAEAAKARSYVGCDYWPTVLANNVWSIFDFAVVVANAGSATASVTVTGNGVSRSTTIAPGSLAKIYLPWVPELKGTDSDACGASIPLTSSMVVKAAAYHLVSSVPVIVTQFSALEYIGQGGPPGKDWSSCPGNSPCMTVGNPNMGHTIGCYSFTNDSSLLLPSSALTGNYRITAYPGETYSGSGQPVPVMSSYIGVTATTNGTHVKVLPSSAGDIVAGSGVTATAAGGELDLTLDAGDVAQLVSDLGADFDLSGSLVTADQPIQVIAGAPCDNVQEDNPACDHLEQSVFPAETLGKHYFVTVPTAPEGYPIGHVVRMTGNVDGTTLKYAPSKPPGCPATLDAGQVVDCGVVGEDFEVTGSHELAVASFQLGGSLVDPKYGLGDPSQSLMASVEQYRVKYVFLAPDDYVVNYADIVAPSGTKLYLDGACVGGTGPSALLGSYEVWRVPLTSSGNGGAHTLEATQPVGLQVLGYGMYTSYQYPGGLNLAEIAPPPVTQ